MILVEMCKTLSFRIGFELDDLRSKLALLDTKFNRVTYVGNSLMHSFASHFRFVLACIAINSSSNIRLKTISHCPIISFNKNSPRTYQRPQPYHFVEQFNHTPAPASFPYHPIRIRPQ